MVRYILIFLLYFLIWNIVWLIYSILKKIFNKKNLSLSDTINKLIRKKDLKKGTVVICTDSNSQYWDIGIYEGNGKISYGYSKISNGRLDMKYQYIIPIDKFDSENLSFNKKYNFGIKRDIDV